ncbi:TetR/AcrR family transcriptional regulator [Caulobacter sp. KR2-114]|uniref:TetR/AcrR family transcriptional regulator n=1 Tax=Caulobacter sp. KR2-114 TaxID=3400912 RepID=UPI003C06A16C
MPKISEAQRETRRQQILDAALRCFSRDGFHNTTTADIVRESGVSQGTLYLYFATKDDIILALADDRHQSEAFLDALAMAEQDPVQGLLTLVDLHGRGLGDPRRIDGRRVGVQGWSEAMRSPAIHDSVVGGLKRVRLGIERLVARGQATGQIRPEVQPEAVARMLIAVFQGFVLQVAWGETLDLPACGRTIRDMIGALLTPKGRETYAAEFPDPSPQA